MGNPRERLGAAVLLGVGFVSVVVSEWIYDSFARPTFWFPDLVAGWSLFAGSTWTLLRRQPRTAVLLALTGVAWVLPNLVPEVPALAVVHRVLLFHTLLAAPTGRLVSPVRRAYVALGYLVLLVPDPTSPRWLVVGACGVVAIGVLDRRERWAALPLSAGGAFAVIGMARILGFSEGRPLVLTALYTVVVAATALGAAGAAVQAGDPDNRLGEEPGSVVLGPAEVVRRTLGSLLDRPGSRLVFEAGDGTYVDELGRVEADPDDNTLVVTAQGGLLGSGGRLVTENGPARRLVRVARRHALLRKQLRDTAEELVESRSRLRSVEDEVRLGLAVELATGPAAALRSVAADLGSGDLDEARAAVAAAYVELNRFALGLGPALLQEGSLASAIGGLAEHCSIPVTVDVRLDEQVEPALAELAYFVCAEALSNAAKHAGAMRVELAIHNDPEGLRVEVSDDGCGGATLAAGLSDLADRVVQRGGRLTVESPVGRGTRLVAVVPAAEGG